MAVALISCVLIFVFSAYYVQSMEGKTKPEDIFVKAILKHNANPRMVHKDVMLEVLIDKKNDTQHMIYPYIPGLQLMSFDNREEKGYFIPGAIGSVPEDEQKVYDTLINEKVINNTIQKEQLNTIGFWSPQEAGLHKMRLYFLKENFNAKNNEIYLIYVHKEQGLFGRDHSWTKLIRVESEI